MTRVHTTAIIGPDVVLADNVEVGAYAIIKGKVTIGQGTFIGEHSHIHAGLKAGTIIGAHCEIGPAAFVGLPAQHLKADRDIGWCILGDNVIVRETATVHRSITAGEENATTIGDRVMIMATAHVGHDCKVANDVVLAQGCMLGGHVVVAEKVFFGGASGMHQFTRVGRLAILGGNETPRKDVPPFAAVRQDRLRGYNAIGCRRAGMNKESIASIRLFYQCLKNHRIFTEAMAAVEAECPKTPEVLELIAFVKASKRGIVTSHVRTAVSSDESDE